MKGLIQSVQQQLRYRRSNTKAPSNVPQEASEATKQYSRLHDAASSPPRVRRIPRCIQTDSSLTAVGSVRSRPHVCSGMHYARPTAGVEPTPLSGPPGVRQGASGAGSVARAWQWPCGPTPLW